MKTPKLYPRWKVKIQTRPLGQDAKWAHHLYLVMTPDSEPYYLDTWYAYPGRWPAGLDVVTDSGFGMLEVAMRRRECSK